MNVLMSVNKKFLENAEEMIFSILYYSSEKINLYMMYQDNELSKEDIKNISEFVSRTEKGRVIPIKFDTKMLNEMPIDDGKGNFFGLEAYSRLFCAFKLPNEVEKILYFDVDMVCTGDIKEIYDIDFEEKMWIACADEGIRHEDLVRLELPSDFQYINSGMLLINTKKLRENYTENDIVNLMKKYHRILIYPDQDFINKVFAKDIKIVSNKYNLLAKCIQHKELKEKPLIIHYAGTTKPWHNDVSRFELEYMEPYYAALRLQKKAKELKLKKLLKAHKAHGYKA